MLDYEKLVLDEFLNQYANAYELIEVPFKIFNSDNRKDFLNLKAKDIENENLFITIPQVRKDLIIDRINHLSIQDSSLAGGSDCIVDFDFSEDGNYKILILKDKRKGRKNKIPDNCKLVCLARNINKEHETYTRSGILCPHLVSYNIDSNFIDIHDKIDTTVFFRNMKLIFEDLYNNSLLIKYHDDLLTRIKINPKGDFIDLRSAETVELKAGEFHLLSLGISVKPPKGYWCQLVPRSSTYMNFKILLTNSFAVIDESYSGNNDIWKAPILAMEDTVIHKNDRVFQFRLVKKEEFPLFIEVDHLLGEDRGGFGSSGIN